MHSDTPGSVDCRAAMAELWDYLDEGLTEERMVAVQLHLQECTHCHPHAEFAERFLEALSRCRSREAMPDSVRQHVMERLRSSGFLT